MKQRIHSLADEVFPDVVAWRRQIHQNPELAREEHQTASLVADTLRRLDLDVRTGIYGTGVVGTLRGAHPGPTILLRADMDALPIHEATGLNFASNHEGQMHACGHDAHTASLLGAATILSRIRDEIHGQIRFCFQPSEEVIPGGAKFMIEEGVLESFGSAGDGASGDRSEDGVDYVFGQHVRPDLPVGTVGIRSGPFMASADEVHITVRGEGGHAAAPHELSADATYVASQIVVGLQSIVSRHAPPGVASILTIGRLIADGATNVIPETARLAGTFRAMDEEWRAEAHKLIERLIHRTAEAHGATAEVDLKVGYPALINDSEAAALVRDASLEFTGADQTLDLNPWYAGEDFAYFLQKRPGAFFTLGVGNPERGITHGLHTPKFDIDEEALRIGAGFMAYLAWTCGVEKPTTSDLAAS
ncbi:N-acyl-L-amino acid amidohydrolase [Longibacter salinarum]|uniref:N-acyl-L-amino acid amidohydrolase n=1 Tax=Longibacter salinarum TaxID=1850348 RepID=A0A2A8CY22_9BACT|nr:M20 family metallopeptidase [Longibacter salinarum]PEN13612.1 N-acyl-L-amino acid amidohydrolase [Longibacter salinarum]